MPQALYESHFSGYRLAQEELVKFLKETFPEVREADFEVAFDNDKYTFYIPRSLSEDETENLKQRRKKNPPR